MIHLLCLVLMGTSGDAPLKLKDVLHVPEAQLLRVVGKRDPSSIREFGLTFLRSGYTKVWVDAAGPKMKQIHFCVAKLYGTKEFLSDVGLGASHVTTHPMAVPASPVPLLRNKLSLSGVTGLPMGADHKAWTVTYVEYALANKIKLKAMKPQIKALPVGEERNKIIRSCYDWYSELDFSGS